MSRAGSVLRARRVRLYQSIRSAHLERARELSPAAIVYQVTRYDFDPSLAEGLELHRAGPAEAARLIADAGVEAIEINEPLMLASLPATVRTLLSLRRRGATPLVVSYAIENADPFAAGTAPRLRTRVRRRLERGAARWVWRRVDRIAFGTEAALDRYRQLLGDATGVSTVIPALPAPCDRADEPPVDPETVLFLGAFVPRKGIRVLLEAWPAVLAARPAAKLVVVGKGALLDEVRAVEGVTLIEDPSRDRIHTALAEAALLVLPSQPTPTWREQVGLPIVEGLQHGCTVVTTAETGLASWLTAHGHRVVERPADAAELAATLLAALDDPVPPAAVRASLPARDGRLAADDWMFAPLDAQRP